VLLATNTPTAAGIGTAGIGTAAAAQQSQELTAEKEEAMALPIVIGTIAMTLLIIPIIITCRNLGVKKRRLGNHEERQRSLMSGSVVSVRIHNLQ